MSHFQEELDHHCVLLCVCGSGQCLRCEEVKQTCGNVQVGYFQDVSLKEVLVEGLQEEEISPFVGYITICIYSRYVACIEKAVN